MSMSLIVLENARMEEFARMDNVNVEKDMEETSV